MAELALDRKLAPVINRIASVIPNSYGTKIRVHTRPGIYSGIKGLTLEQVLSSRAYIRGGYDKSTRQFSLDVQIPLLIKRISQITCHNCDSTQWDGYRLRSRWNFAPLSDPPTSTIRLVS